MNQEGGAHFKTPLAPLAGSDGETGAMVEAVDKLSADSKYQLLPLLDTLASGQNTEGTRIMASMLMQSLLSDEFDETYLPLPADKQEDIKTQLLTMVQNEQNPDVRKRACELTALLALKLLDGGSPDNQWPDFPEFLCSWSYSPSPELRQAALDIFAAAPGMFGTQQSPSYRQLTSHMLSMGLTDPCVDVNMAALRAVFRYVSTEQSQETVQAVLAVLLPWMLQILVSNVKSADGGAVIQCFADLVGTYPGVLAFHKEAVKQVCLKAVADPSVPDSQRNQIHEIIRKLSG